MLDKKNLDWYRLLFLNLATEKLEDFRDKNENLIIVTFNYDRSLEYYLINYLINFLNNNYLGYKKEEYFEQYNKISIKHIYGSFGEILSIPYGKKDKFIEHYLEKSSNIKLIPEARNIKENPEII